MILSFTAAGYRALIEENVVTGVRRIAESSLIRNVSGSLTLMHPLSSILI